MGVSELGCRKRRSFGCAEPAAVGDGAAGEIGDADGGYRGSIEHVIENRLDAGEVLFLELECGGTAEQMDLVGKTLRCAVEQSGALLAIHISEDGSYQQALQHCGAQDELPSNRAWNKPGHGAISLIVLEGGLAGECERKRCGRRSPHGEPLLDGRWEGGFGLGPSSALSRQRLPKTDGDLCAVEAPILYEDFVGSFAGD